MQPERSALGEWPGGQEEQASPLLALPLESALWPAVSPSQVMQLGWPASG